jgi:hypothetical protein
MLTVHNLFILFVPELGHTWEVPAAQKLETASPRPVPLFTTAANEAVRSPTVATCSTDAQTESATSAASSQEPPRADHQ